MSSGKRKQASFIIMTRWSLAESSKSNIWRSEKARVVQCARGTAGQLVPVYLETHYTVLSANSGIDRIPGGAGLKIHIS